MEALWRALRKGSSLTEVDHVYENIEAPKFVDFTAPDGSRLDSRSWFCARIGCDEDHEEVDPDVIDRNFVLRVMAARSPNVRLWKALRRHGDASSSKYPRSAPAKPAKSKIGRFVENRGNSARLKNHPVAGLSSSTPKPPRRPPLSEKAMTTPRNRVRQTGEASSRSAKICRPQETLPRNNAAAKALIFRKPKQSPEETHSIRGLVSELSSGMKKLKIGTPRSDKEAEERLGGALPSSTSSSGNPTAVNPLASKAEAPGDSSEFDENKENASSAVHCAAERAGGMENRPERSCGGPRKAVPTSAKNQTKFRALKPTSPKPFRLRTDERQILREKNLERESRPEKEEKPKARILKDQRRAAAAPAPAPAPEKEVMKKSSASRAPGSFKEQRGAAAAPPPEEGGGGRKEEKKKKTLAAITPKALTVPRAPKFTKVNVPKGCVRRFGHGVDFD